MKPATISINTQFTYNRKLVLWATGMSDEELNYFIVEMADTWLRRFFDGKINHDAVLNSPGFLGWWRMHWYTRDEEYFIKELFEAPDDYRYVKYRQLHQSVFYLLYPNSQFMYKDFIDMRSFFEAKEAPQTK